MYIPKSVRDKLKNAEIGTVVYHKDRKGFVTSHKKIEYKGDIVTVSHIVGYPPDWKPPRLPLTIAASPPVPFKTWSDYHKIFDLKKA